MGIGRGCRHVLWRWATFGCLWAAVLTAAFPRPQVSSAPELQWVDQSGGSSFTSWAIASSSPTSLVVVASVVAGNKTQADVYVAAAKDAGRERILAANERWWAEYWPQSFVSIPVTRIEG